MRTDVEPPIEHDEPKHYVLEVQSAIIRGTTTEVKAAEVEAPEEAEEKNDG